MYLLTKSPVATTAEETVRVQVLVLVWSLVLMFVLVLVSPVATTARGYLQKNRIMSDSESDLPSVCTAT